jgi:uncharacterized protein YidB (DUF937 family)
VDLHGNRALRLPLNRQLPPQAATKRKFIKFISCRRLKMGLLDQVLGGLMGGAGGSSSPMGGVLASLLGGGQSGGMGAQGIGGMGGGLGGLVSQFEQAGLGHVAQSWVGNGPNQPVSPQQLQNVFGENQVQDMASQAGMQPQDFLSQLSQHLPNAVHGMTPNGQLPDEGTLSV